MTYYKKNSYAIVNVNTINHHRLSLLPFSILFLFYLLAFFSLGAFFNCIRFAFSSAIALSLCCLLVPNKPVLMRLLSPIPPLSHCLHITSEKAGIPSMFCRPSSERKPKEASWAQGNPWTSCWFHPKSTFPVLIHKKPHQPLPCLQMFLFQQTLSASSPWALLWEAEELNEASIAASWAPPGKFA